MVQLRINFGSTSVQLQFNFGSTSVQLRFNSVSTPVQLRFNSVSTPVQLRIKAPPRRLQSASVSTPKTKLFTSPQNLKNTMYGDVMGFQRGKLGCVVLQVHNGIQVCRWNTMRSSPSSKTILSGIHKTYFS